MINYDVVNKFVYEFLSLISESKNNTHWHARCPLCGDSKKNSRKKRFHLDYNNGNPIWNCFNCNRSGSFLEIYAELKCIDIDEAKIELFGFDTIRDRLSNREIFLNNIQKDKKINYETFNWIREKSISRFEKSDGILCKKYKEILDEFVRDRKISTSYDILICYEGDYKNRIIVPVIDRNDNIIYFQARRLPNSNVQPKYINPKVEKSTIILNEDKFDKNKSIIITEGLIDAFSIGNQATSCLGGFFSDDFLNIIQNYTNKNIILAFDNPFVDKTGYRNIFNFIKGSSKKPSSIFSKKVKYFIPSKEHIDAKDINMIDVKYSIGDMYEYIVKNSYSYMETYVKLKFDVNKR
jgi:hypothetical protein